VWLHQDCRATCFRLTEEPAAFGQKRCLPRAGYKPCRWWKLVIFGGNFTKTGQNVKKEKGGFGVPPRLSICPFVEGSLPDPLRSDGAAEIGIAGQIHDTRGGPETSARDRFQRADKFRVF
jgi:hypothetical protein